MNTLETNIAGFGMVLAVVIIYIAHSICFRKFCHCNTKNYQEEGYEVIL